MSVNNPLISINGVVGAQLSPLDRGFAFGDGLFETCRVIAHKVPLWNLHEERLAEGCRRLSIPLDRARLKRYLRDLLQMAGQTDGVVKVIVTRGMGGRGYRQPELIEPSYCVAVFPAAEPAAHSSGIVARVCQQRLSLNPSLAGIKHLNRLEQVLARAEWHDERIAEGLLLDVAGNVIEATASNLAIIRHGELCTPDLSSTGVAGVMRRLIIERLAVRVGLRVRVLNMTLEDIYNADEIFVCNSINGIWPVVKLVDEKVVRYPVGPYTLSLQSALEEYLQDSDSIAGEWL
jgi:4-amino-4-deoxychorismate lyase